MQNNPDPVYIAVSSCLLGENVRYDGTNCHNDYINGRLTKYLKLIPVCPENLIGLGTPRPPIQLVQTQHGIRSIGVYNKNQDVTAELKQCATDFLLQHTGISGLILKSKSPSCGVHSSKLYDHNDQLLDEHASGIFAQKIQSQCSYIPLTGEDGLLSIQGRLEFLVRVYAISRLNIAIKSSEPVRALKQFHQQYYPLIRTLSVETAAQQDSLIFNSHHEQDQTLVNKTYYDGFTRIIAQSLDRSVLSQYLNSQLPDNLTLSARKTFVTLIQNYTVGLIEWPELLTHIDDIIAGSDNAQALKNNVSGLLPPSILV